MNRMVLDRLSQSYIKHSIENGQVVSVVQFFFPVEEGVRVEFAAIGHADAEEKARSLEDIRQYAKDAQPVAVQIVLDVWTTVTDRSGTRKVDGLFICSELANGQRWASFAEIFRDKQNRVADIQILSEISDMDVLEGWEIFEHATIQ